MLPPDSAMIDESKPFSPPREHRSFMTRSQESPEELPSSTHPMSRSATAEESPRPPGVQIRSRDRRQTPLSPLPDLHRLLEGHVAS
ncbi:hypothetical protein M6B38_164610 [Iris pallida]|uniref:Uncharacterized protein n=1 Tax=Iris pallida TaxID=29817 RepID=A0AAX6EX69_IRIPA|nr:hypothetical protein M6B38_164610 [Iris pallida]